MGFIYSSYFGLARVSDMGPEAKGWAVTDMNPEVISKILYALTRHTHGGSTPLRYPGYNYSTPATPISPVLTELIASTGTLPPGTTLGVRLSYLTNIGLETEASPEIRLVMAPAPQVPAPPSLTAPISTPIGTALGGGTYVYALTKGKGSGESPMSGITTVDVPFDPTRTTSYVVPVNFDPLITYSDGSDALNIYRSTGLTAEFRLVTTITATPVAAFNDTGGLVSPVRTPPRTNTFDRNKVGSIDVRTLSHPSDATKLRVYVTTNPGVYGTQNLLKEIDLTTPTGLGTGIFNYQGSERLLFEYPKEFSQVPIQPSKLNLGLEGTGAPILTTAQDFRGYPAKAFVFGDQNTATPINGNAYLDSSANQFKIRIAGSYFTLATPNGTFVHSAAEPGGHNSQNILFGSFNLQQVAGIIANSAGNQVRKQVSSYLLATPSYNNYVTTTSAAAYIPEMVVAQFTPDFAGQLCEISFTGGFYLDPQGLSGATGTFQFEINGSATQGDPSARSFTAVATPCHLPVTLNYATPLSAPVTVKVIWSTSAGALTSVGPRRQLMVKELF